MSLLFAFSFHLGFNIILISLVFFFQFLYVSRVDCHIIIDICCCHCGYYYKRSLLGCTFIFGIGVSGIEHIYNNIIGYIQNTKYKLFEYYIRLPIPLLYIIPKVSHITHMISYNCAKCWVFRSGFFIYEQNVYNFYFLFFFFFFIRCALFGSLHHPTHVLSGTIERSAYTTYVNEFCYLAITTDDDGDDDTSLKSISNFQISK